MILSFKKQFVRKILDGTKIHTIREDRHKRWHEGRKIHFATGVRTPDYNQFQAGICRGVQKIRLIPDLQWVLIGEEEKLISSVELALNDGFEKEEDLWDWFDTPFEGRLIHWTNYNY